MIDQERRAIYRQVIESFPMFAPDLMQAPSYAIYSNLHEDYGQDFSVTDGIAEETLVFNFQQSVRLMKARGVLLDALTGAAIYGIALHATNAALGYISNPSEYERLTTMVLLRDSILKPYIDWRQIGEQELGYSKHLIQYNIEFSKARRFENNLVEPLLMRTKENWYLEDVRMVHQQIIEFSALNDLVYWSSSLELKRHWFVVLTERFHSLGRDFSMQEHLEKTYLEQMDFWRSLEAKRLVTAALRSIYLGAPIEDHGIDAPIHWRWVWQGESGELCLKLSDEFEHSERIEAAATCMPNIQYLLSETKQS